MQTNQTDALALAHENLLAYSFALFPPFEDPAHVRFLVRELERVERGENTRLMLFLPPRHSKSLNATQLFPSWALGRNPNWDIITTCYGEDLATDFGRIVRNIVTSPLHSLIFPGFQVASDATGMARLATQQGGNYYAVGRGQAITGRGAQLIVIDDPIKDMTEASSPVIRRAIQQWYQTVLYPRLSADGRIILVQTRWNQDDLGGWLLREHPEENWRVVSLPALAEPHDLVGRKEGEPLWPERYPLSALQRIRQQIGPSAWASLYQQRPTPDGGAVFKQEWWQRYDAQPHFRRIIQSWDTSFGKTRQSDFSACVTIGESDAGFHVVSVWHDRVDFPTLKQKFIEMAAFWKPNSILVEDAASGQSMVQELKATHLPIIPVKVDSDKITRAQATTGMVESGRVFLPLAGGWLTDFLEEVSAFPSAPHDDMVDAFTMALNYLRGDDDAFGLLGYFASGQAGEDLSRIDATVNPPLAVRVAGILKQNEQAAPAQEGCPCGAGPELMRTVGGGARLCVQCGGMSKSTNLATFATRRPGGLATLVQR